ncbi:hypothetical protein [Tepidibacter formicigenes]|uniref:Uncharacterized protein n=1 Tax=Tepidibacter formicigenes DSM 15518 TaxID=1123349 RepID=A0A1M6SM55_9FIRM|nr:hypothetical protein [Tepidibacter formicigenes]SHK45720.1 hypothetical protein SAMN02744037_02372 [Tepidibacter formicigenes DSM 15518]
MNDIQEREKRMAELGRRISEQPKKISTLKFKEIENITFSELEKKKVTW